MKKILLLFLSLPLLFTACGPKTITPDIPVQKEQASAPAPVTSTPAESPRSIQMEALSEGLVVFTSGDVFVRRDGEENYLDIGDMLFQDDIVGTGPDSYCEIQLGEIAVVRMEAESLITMSSLFSSESGSRMGVDLEEGQVLCKVKKLLEDDSFKVKAGTVVCGVRGTEFGVSSRGDEKVLLAVKEGAVAVTPVSLEKVSELSRDEESLRGVASLIQEASLVVGASEELNIEDETFKDLEEIAPVLEQVVQKIEEKNTAREKQEAAGEAGTEEQADLEEAVAVLEQEVSRQARDILTVIESKPEIVAPAVLEKKEISEESKKVLESTDQMELITFAAPETEEKARSESSAPAAPVLPTLYKVAVRVVPADAEIISAGRVIARGSLSKLYSEGKTLSLEFRLEGYKAETLNITVDENMEAEYAVELKPEEDQNTSLPIQAPEENMTAPIAAADPAASVPGSVDTAAEPVRVALTTSPADAALKIDGSSAGKGSWDGKVKPGDQIRVSAERNGYAPASLTLTVPPEGLERVITLDPRPLEVSNDLSSAGLVGVLAGDPSLMIGADTAGKLTAFDRNGKLLWQYASANSPNANSSAVLHNGKVYFSGGSELVILSSKEGSLVSRIPLEEERSHIYGRQVMPLDGDILYPANDELVLMDSSGNEQASYSLPEGSSMSPALWEGKILIADKKGELLIMDPADGSIITSVSTGSLQSVAQSPAVQGNIAVFTSRKGVVSAVDLTNETVLWERDLDSTVFANIVASPEGCYVFTTKREVYPLSWESGEDLFSPLKDISSAPGYAQGQLYITTTSGIMRILNARTGTVAAEMDLGDSFSARPIIREGLVFGVGRKGKFYRINPAGLE